MRNSGLDAGAAILKARSSAACLKHETPYFTSSSFMIFSIGLETWSVCSGVTT